MPIIVPVEELDLLTVTVVGAACGISSNVTAVHVIVDPDHASTVEARWRKQVPDVPFVVIDSPYRTLAEPIAAYADDRTKSEPQGVVVMVPFVELKHRYQRPLVNQSLKRLAGLLADRRHVSVTLFPFSPGGRGHRA